MSSYLHQRSQEEETSDMENSGSVKKTEEVGGEAIKNEADLNIHFTDDSIEAMGMLHAEKVHEIINQWEGSFFKDNPRLRKKSMSLRIEVHLEGDDNSCSPNKKDDLPNIEARMILRRFCSDPTVSH